MPISRDSRARWPADPTRSSTSRCHRRCSTSRWDQWESIVCRPERALWYGEDLLFRIRFDHLGFSFSKPVRLHVVENGQAREILFDPTLFDYGRSGLKPTDLPKDLGFAGFNVLFHTDWTSDRAVFQGASYFRAVDSRRTVRHVAARPCDRHRHRRSRRSFPISSRSISRSRRRVRRF